MNPVRFLTIVAILLISTSMVFAAGTAANTKIEATAYGNYTDVNANAYSAESNTVITAVAQVAGVEVTPATAGTDIVANSFVLYDAAVRNNGNYRDVLALSAAVNGSPAGTYTVEIYNDGDNNGIIDGADAIVSSTDSLDVDTWYNLTIKVIEDSGDNTFTLESFDVTLTAVSAFDGTNDAGVFSSTIIGPALVVTVTGDNETPNPGETITYSVCLDNTGGTDAAYDVNFSLDIPGFTTYVLQSMETGTTGHGNGTTVTDETGDDSGDYNSTNPGGIYVVLGDIAAGGSICVYFQVTVDVGTPPGTELVIDPDLTFDNLDGPGGTAYEDPSPTGTGQTITVSTIRIVTVAAVGSTTSSGYPNDEIVYVFSVSNDGNVVDDYAISFVSDSSWSWVFYLDAGPDGTYDGDETVLSGGLTGNIAIGDSVQIIMVATIPTDDLDGAVDGTVVTATSQGDGGVTDTVTLTTTVTSPILTLVKTVDQALAAPEATLLYTIVVSNSGSVDAMGIVITDEIPGNTTFVSGSMEVDSVPVADNIPGGHATFNLGTIASGGSKTLTFEVTID